MTVTACCPVHHTLQYQARHIYYIRYTGVWFGYQISLRVHLSVAVRIWIIHFISVGTDESMVTTISDREDAATLRWCDVAFDSVGVAIISLWCQLQQPRQQHEHQQWWVAGDDWHSLLWNRCAVSQSLGEVPVRRIRVTISCVVRTRDERNLWPRATTQYATLLFQECIRSFVIS